jgi:hypothetical protein
MLSPNFDLLLRLLVLSMPDLPPNARHHAKNLLAILDTERKVVRHLKVPTAAQVTFATRPLRAKTGNSTAPNPEYVSRGQPIAAEWTTRLLRALAPGCAHLKVVRERMHAGDGRRAMAWRYAWVLHYLWSTGLVVGIARKRTLDWELTEAGVAHLAEIDGGDGPK